MENAEAAEAEGHKRNQALVALDRQTHMMLKEEGAKYGLSMAAVVRILVQKLRAGKVVII